VGVWPLVESGEEAPSHPSWRTPSYWLIHHPSCGSGEVDMSISISRPECDAGHCIDWGQIGLSSTRAGFFVSRLITLGCRAHNRREYKTHPRGPPSPHPFALLFGVVDPQEVIPCLIITYPVTSCSNPPPSKHQLSPSRARFRRDPRTRKRPMLLILITITTSAFLQPRLPRLVFPSLHVHCPRH
jgi:hypothetical protein